MFSALYEIMAGIGAKERDFCRNNTENHFEYFLSLVFDQT